MDKNDILKNVIDKMFCRQSTPECRLLLDSIEHAKEEMRLAERGFCESTNSDLVDYFTHRRIAAQAQYAFLINQYKESI